VPTSDEQPGEEGQSAPAGTSAAAGTSGGTGTSAAATQDPTSWGVKVHSVRFRVVAAMLVMMLAGLVTAGLVTFVVQFQESDARIDQAILDRAKAVVKLVQTGKRTSEEAANSTASSALHEAAEDVEPRSNEVMAGIVGGRVAWTVEGNPHRTLLNDAMFADAAGLRNAAGAVFAELDADGSSPLRTVVVPMKGATVASGTFLLVGRDAADQREHNISTVRTYSLVALGTLLAAAVIGGIVAGRLLNPLRRLREASSAVSQEDFTQRVKVRKGEDDVTLLAKTFNTMLERLDEGAQQQQQFLDDAGHELRTPLTILRGHLELETVDDPEDVVATREVLLDEVDRMQRLVDDLLLLANSGDPGFIRREPVLIPELLDQVMEKVHVLADRHWKIDEKADFVVDADPQRLTQALVQLAANAVKYTKPSSTIALGSRIEGPTAADGSPVPASDTLLLWVRDDGIGIAAEDQQRIFERFGRAHPGRGEEGSGLGLAIVAAIAQAHGGMATVDSAYGHGATFLIRIPLQSTSVRA